MRAGLGATAGLLLAACGVMPAGGGTPPATNAATPADRTALAREVTETERAFARTMAERDHAAFARFLADEAVFFGGADRVLRGKAAVAAAWQPFFAAPQAPFAWAPQTVEVLESGGLALSSGPVRDPKGQPIGSFTSIWRREAPGVWRIVFDKGCGCVDAQP